MNRSWRSSAVIWMMPARSRATVTLWWSPSTWRVPAVCGKPRSVPIAARTATATSTSETRIATTWISREMNRPTRRIEGPPLAGKSSAETGRRGGPDDRVGEHDIRQPDAEVGHEHAARRTQAAIEDGLAERGAGVRIAVERAGLA